MGDCACGLVLLSVKLLCMIHARLRVRLVNILNRISLFGVLHFSCPR